MYLDLLYFLSRRRRRAELLMESLRKRSPRVVGGIITQDKVSAQLHVLCCVFLLQLADDHLSGLTIRRPTERCGVCSAPE